MWPRKRSAPGPTAYRPTSTPVWPLVVHATPARRSSMSRKTRRRAPRRRRRHRGGGSSAAESGRGRARRGRARRRRRRPRRGGREALGARRGGEQRRRVEGVDAVAAERRGRPSRGRPSTPPASLRRGAPTSSDGGDGGVVGEDVADVRRRVVGVAGVVDARALDHQKEAVRSAPRASRRAGRAPCRHLGERRLVVRSIS